MKTLQNVTILSICICSFFLCHNCGRTDIANNTRVLVKGRVVDADNNPVSNAIIQVYTIGSSYSSDTILIGSGETNSTGDYEITSLFGRNESFSIEIELDNTYSRYAYRTNTINYTPENLTFDIPDVTLVKLSNFNYDISRTSGLDTTLSYSFNFISPECVEFYDEGELNSDLSQCFMQLNRGGILNTNNPDVTRSLAVPLNTFVEFSYAINDGTTMTQSLFIDTENYEFDFTY